MKKQYFLILDVETANSTDDPLVYDLGFVVADRQGNIYESESLVIADIFVDEADLMETAYYHEKLPRYREDLKNGSRTMTTLAHAKYLIHDLMEKYDINTVCAYNASFDSRALNVTSRYVTKSKYRYFLPYGTEINCIWHMACQVICTQKNYRKFCEQNGFISASGNLQTSAEVVYRYMTKDTDFDESHTGLEDVLIETAIMKKCYDQHKKMDKSINRLCWRIPQKR